MQNNKKPLISVLMGVYYRREDLYLLKRSVESVLKQTFTDFELLICDDGSTEAAIEYLNGLASQDCRVKLIRRGNLFSLPQKLNACLECSNSTYIARMDDDDFSHPERFADQLSFLAEQPEIAFVGSNVNLWRDGAVVGSRILAEYPSVRDFYFVQPYIHPALMFRREVLVAVAGYSEEKHAVLCEDYDLLLRLYAAGYQGANLQKCLLDYAIPATAKGNRKMKHRWNEAVTRWKRFKELGCLRSAFPYVVKPLVVGLVPERLLGALKARRGSGVRK